MPAAVQQVTRARVREAAIKALEDWSDVGLALSCSLLLGSNASMDIDRIKT